MKTNVLQLGRDWFEVERPAVSGKGRAKVETIKKRRPVRDTKFFTVQEVADKLRYGYHAVYLWCKQGIIDAQPLPRGYIISDDALEEFLQKLREKGTG